MCASQAEPRTCVNGGRGLEQRWGSRGRFVSDFLVLGLSLALFAAVLPWRPEIASAVNLEHVLLGTTLLATLAIGQTFVLVAGSIDLAIPAVMSMASVAGATLLTQNTAVPLAGRAAMAFALMLVIGSGVGAIQGGAVAFWRMPAFLVSLAVLMFLGGFAVWYTRAERIAVPEEFTQIWYGRFYGVPYPLIVALAVAVAAHGSLNHTVAGRQVRAVGQNLNTAAVSGVPVGRSIVLAYIASGCCAAVASTLWMARLYTGSPQLVENEVLLDCIGAAVIGGTSLSGGRGTVAGAVAGALFITLLGNSLNMLGLRYWHIVTIKGAVILMAALIDALRNRYLAQRL